MPLASAFVPTPKRFGGSKKMSFMNSSFLCLSDFSLDSLNSVVFVSAGFCITNVNLVACNENIP